MSCAGEEIERPNRNAEVSGLRRQRKADIEGQVKAVAVLIWVCAAALLVLGGCSALAHASGGAATPIPDLPEGWAKAGAAGLVVLVVLLFLTYLGLMDRRQKRLDTERVEKVAELHKEHAQRIADVAQKLSDQFCKSIADQQEHCKSELSLLTAGYREQIEFLKAQNNTFAARFLSLSSNASADQVKASERLGS